MQKRLLSSGFSAIDKNFFGAPRPGVSCRETPGRVFCSLAAGIDFSNSRVPLLLPFRQNGNSRGPAAFRQNPFSTPAAAANAAFAARAAAAGGQKCSFFPGIRKTTAKSRAPCHKNSLHIRTGRFYASAPAAPQGADALSSDKAGSSKRFAVLGCLPLCGSSASGAYTSTPHRAHAFLFIRPDSPAAAWNGWGDAAFAAPWLQSGGSVPALR